MEYMVRNLGVPHQVLVAIEVNVEVMAPQSRQEALDERHVVVIM